MASTVLKLFEIKRLADKAMVVAPPKPQITQDHAEKRVTLQPVTWEGYLQILEALPQSRGSRLTYDRGILEITMPLEDHEFSLRLIELFIRILVFEMGMKIKTMGSTTMNFPKIKRGSEPDCAYYIQHQPQVAGRTVNFAVDPPPDLVVEVDITHTDIDKNQLYAAIGIAEFWRYNGEILRIYHLDNGEYQESEKSQIFPIIEKNELYAFLAQAQQDEIEAERTFRSYIQTKV